MRKVAAGESGEMPAVPLTVRQLEAIVRISESLARMALQPVATGAGQGPFPMRLPTACPPRKQAAALLPRPVAPPHLRASTRLPHHVARAKHQTTGNHRRAHHAQTETHVKMAIDMFKVSTMDAVKSGVTDAIAFTEEQRAELHMVEAQVRRRRGAACLAGLAVVPRPAAPPPYPPLLLWLVGKATTKCAK